MPRRNLPELSRSIILEIAPEWLRQLSVDGCTELLYLVLATTSKARKGWSKAYRDGLTLRASNIAGDGRNMAPSCDSQDTLRYAQPAKLSGKEVGKDCIQR